MSAVLGVTLGATSSLASDIRLNITYVSIMMVPLFFTLIFIDNMPIHLILAISLFLYYVAQTDYIYKVFIQAQEVTELESKQIFLHNLFKEAPLGIFMYDKDLRITDCNEQLGRLFNRKIENLIGLNLKNLPDKRPFHNFIDALTIGKQSYTGPYTSIKGTKYWIDVKSFPFKNNKDDATLGGIAILEDKTKEHATKENLEYLVEHDSLTGLLNRRGFTNYINNLVNDETHKTHYSILFYLDLNQFKGINDSLGHAVGDEVLLTVSARLVDILNGDCMISRLGGDEFIIMVPHVSDKIDAAYLKAEENSNNIQNIFVEPFIINQLHLHVQASIGIVMMDPGYTNTEEIIRHADLTMYQAKSDSSHISYYNSSLDEKQKELFMLQHNLAYAAQNNQFQLFFQPVVSMKEESLISAELLIRWEHPVKGMLSPEEFIPLAIKAGLLSKITWWLIDNVCHQISQWKKEGQWKLQYISVNINSQQLLENNFSTEFFKKLKLYGIEAHEIMIEITERSLIDSFARTQGVINVLRSHGIKCAIDDFGTGYSSLSYLKKLSFHTLKIDRTFVQDIGQSPKELVLMNTILDIGRQFNYNIIIEGIENDQQKQALLALDENLSYQGYFFSKPIKAEEFTKKFFA
jgi:diguanylate cyclase (GGDEF)-like protein